MPAPRATIATVRSIHDRVARAQHAYAVRLREAIEALEPLLDEGDRAAADLARSIESELNHIKFGSAIVDD